MCYVCTECFNTHAVADSSVFDDVVALENTEGFDLLLEVLQGRLLVGLQLLHSDQLTRVITQRVITAKLNAAEVSLEKCFESLRCWSGHT